MEGSKWSNKVIEQFLRIYMKHPCLWDFNHENYVSKVERYIAHEDILAEMRIPGMDMNSLKRKIHSIRNTYTNERRKIERSKQMDPNNIYKPRIRWYYLADKFLGRIALSRKKIAAANSLMTAIARRTAFDYPDHGRSNYESADCLTHPEVSISAIEGIIRSNRSKTELQGKSTDLAENGFNGASPTVVNATYHPGTSRSFPEVAWKEEPVEISEEDGLEDIIAESFEHQQPEVVHVGQPQGDELEAFSRSVLLQMRRLPEEYNIDLMSEIQRLISQKRREYLYAQAKYGTPQNSMSRHLSSYTSDDYLLKDD